MNSHDANGIHVGGFGSYPPERAVIIQSLKPAHAFEERLSTLAAGHCLFTAEFQSLLAAVGVASVKLPPQSPNLNAYAERFVRSIKESCLDRLVLFGENSLRTAIREFVVHYLRERHHQGLGNGLILPELSESDKDGTIQRRQRLGGMLNYYYRAA